MKNLLLIAICICLYSGCTNQAKPVTPQPVTQQAPAPQQQPTTQAQAVQPQPQVPKLTAAATAQEWQAILNIINQSTAPHTDVTAATNFLINQLNAQAKPEKK